MVSITTTPNPLSRQFSSGRPFFSSGSYSFHTTEEASLCPLALELLGQDCVAHVLITPLFITVTLVDETLWTMHENTLHSIITTFLNSDEPVVIKQESAEAPMENPNDIFSEVQRLLDQHATPVVTEHGGHIRLVNINDGIVFVELQGACDGCPSALETLKNGIENLLCFYLPSIKEVRATNLPH